MKTKQQIIELLTSCKPEMEKRFGVKRLALFGSYSRDEQKPDSDVDILVEVTRKAQSAASGVGRQ